MKNTFIYEGLAILLVAKKKSISGYGKMPKIEEIIEGTIGFTLLISFLIAGSDIKLWLALIRGVLIPGLALLIELSIVGAFLFVFLKFVEEVLAATSRF